MTGLLKETLTEQAASVTEPALDLDAIVRTGDRRIRRRRLASGLTVAAAVAIVAGGIVAAQTVTGAEQPPPASGVPTFADRRPTYATGDKIHYGTDTIKVGPAKIVSFIQTDAGFVYTSANGDVFLADGHRTTKIGGGNKRLEVVADDQGSLVGWVDARSAIREFVLYDVAAGREVARSGVGNESGPPPNSDREPRVIAIDEGQAYFSALDGFHRREVATGKDTLIRSGWRFRFLYDVARGQLAYEVLEAGGGTAGLAVGPDLTSRKVIADGDGDLSPDAKYVFSEFGDETHLTAVDGSGEIKLKAGYDLLALSAWLDNDRFTTIGMKNQPDPKQPALIDLLTCTVSTATCTVSVPAFASFPAEGATPAFQFPNGRPLNN